MNPPFHKGSEAVEQSFANFDRRIALSFGVLILALMVIVLLAGGFYYRDFAEREQDKLSTLVTQILAKSVNRISFSGKYHSRLLLEEIARNEPGISYIRVADKQGNVLASSNPTLNDTQLDQGAQAAAAKVLSGQPRVIRDFRIDDDPIREFTVPYLSGLDSGTAGVIQVGLLDRDRGTAFRHGLLIVGALVLILMIVGILVTRSISLRFGRPVIRLASDLSATLQAIPDLMFELDQEGRYLSVMAARENLLAAPRELLLGHTVREMLPEQAADTVMNALTEAGKSGSAYGLEISLPVDEGTGWFELSVSKKAVAAGEKSRYIVLSRDITGRKLAEEEIRKLNADLEQRVHERTRELAASEERMRQFFERQLVGMAITSPKKDWVEVNDKICEMLGYSREELLRLNWAEMTYPEDLAAEVTQFDKLLRGEIDNYMLEERFVRKDGGLVFTNLAVGCVRGTDRSVDYVLALLEDISERKGAEAHIRGLNVELQKRARALEDANKELEEFSYSMSHDLRSPLRAIIGFARILVDEHAGGLDSEGRRLLDVVQVNTVRMSRLIDELLEFLQLGRRQMLFVPVDMTQLVQEVFAELQATVPDRDMHLELKGLPPLLGDRIMIRRMLTNLLSNAIKFTRQRQHAVIEVGGHMEDGEYYYYIKDNGVGFDMKYVDKLFKVFEHVHPVEQFEGSGTGLAMVKRIVSRHGGRVWAEGQVDAGATIHFTFPARSDQHDTGQ